MKTETHKLNSRSPCCCLSRRQQITSGSLRYAHLHRRGHLESLWLWCFVSIRPLSWAN
ncbi:unnamed protein product [Brassica oleracea var. botrytis]|uniref:(rape) hypothetical protein n=1 Tax=Brassica napus TaxID=3708 RepID=A0A816KPP6_BRANA|nr:unnamed protein product [Brassica napus]